MRNTKYKNGFTLVELIVALMVTAIISTAVASLAYALGTVNDSTGQVSESQAQLRYTTVRISDLIKHCRLICATAGDDMAIWRADENGDGKININELVYISAGPNRDHIRLYECNNASNPEITLSDIDPVGTSWWLGFYDSETYIELVPGCSNVNFQANPAPPRSMFVSVSFDTVENNITRHFQITGAVRGWAGHLLTAGGQIVSGDDDEQ